MKNLKNTYKSMKKIGLSVKHLSNAVRQANSQQTAFGIESTAHHLGISLSVLNK